MIVNFLLKFNKNTLDAIYILVNYTYVDDNLDDNLDDL